MALSNREKDEIYEICELAVQAIKTDAVKQVSYLRDRLDRQVAITNDFPVAIQKTQNEAMKWQQESAMRYIQVQNLESKVKTLESQLQSCKKDLDETKNSLNISRNVYVITNNELVKLKMDIAEQKKIENRNKKNKSGPNKAGSKKSSHLGRRRG